MIFISVHIPKTAGTSLAYVFDHGTDRAVLYDYRADYTNFMFSAEEETQFLQARDYVLSKFRFIHEPAVRPLISPCEESSDIVTVRMF